MENYILNKLEEWKDDNLISFHVPGHKMGKIFKKLGYENSIKEIYTLDTTEIDGTDNLHNAKEIIKDSQDRAAKIFNSDKTIFLVNGSTCGIEAAIMSVCNPKSKIIVNRDCHQSTINASKALKLAYQNSQWKHELNLLMEFTIVSSNPMAFQTYSTLTYSRNH